jgi:hypothetical protein
VDQRPDQHADEQRADEDPQEEAALPLLDARDDDAGQERDRGAEHDGRGAVAHRERDHGPQGDGECGEKGVHILRSDEGCR